MKIYRQVFFPWLVNRLMRCEMLTDLRKDVLSPAQGQVLEIGCGSGLNLPYMPSEARHLTCSDPNPGMLRLLIRSIPQQQRKHTRVLGCNAERLPFLGATFDTVISTWTLCSIPDVESALSEVRRVLKPGGLFLFVEHGKSPEPRIATWQRRLTPLQRRLADGCHLDRDIEGLVTRSGLQIVNLKKNYLDGAPKLFGYTFLGTALRP